MPSTGTGAAKNTPQVRERVALSAEPMAKVAGGSDVVRGRCALPVVLGPSQGSQGPPRGGGRGCSVQDERVTGPTDWSRPLVGAVGERQGSADDILQLKDATAIRCPVPTVWL